MKNILFVVFVSVINFSPVELKENPSEQIAHFNVDATEFACDISLDSRSGEYRSRRNAYILCKNGQCGPLCPSIASPRARVV